MRIPYICPISFLDHTAPICWQGKYVYSSRTMNGEQLSRHVTVERKNKLNKMEIRDGGVRTCIKNRVCQKNSLIVKKPTLAITYVCHMSKRRSSRRVQFEFIFASPSLRQPSSAGPRFSTTGLGERAIGHGLRKRSKSH